MADTAAVNQLVDHFFRHESGTLVSLLTRLFGLHHLDLVEDVVQAALLQALETWKLQGVPRDPAGWMYRVARNKALDLVRRRNVADRLASEVGRYQAGRRDRQHAFEHLFVDRELQDSQLRMMFACCHPELPAESQIALTLKTLGGLSTREIARALLTTEANIKRLSGNFLPSRAVSDRTYGMNRYVSWGVATCQGSVPYMRMKTAIGSALKPPPGGNGT